MISFRYLAVFSTTYVLFSLLFLITSAYAEVDPIEPQIDYLSYKFSSADYPAKLIPMVSKIENTLSSTNPSKDALKSQIDLINSSFDNYSRGYHDELFFIKGYAEEKAGLHKEAIQSYTEALKKRARDPHILFRRAFNYKQIKKYESAIEDLNEAKWWLKQVNPAVDVLLAESFFGLNKPEKANKLLEVASLNRPDYLPAKRLLLNRKIKELRREGNTPHGEHLSNQIYTSLEQMSLLEPRNSKITKLYAEFALPKIDPVLDSLKYNDIETKLAGVVKSSELKDEAAVELYVNYLKKAGKLDVAKSTLKKALNINPNSDKLLDLEAILAIEDS